MGTRDGVLVLVLVLTRVLFSVLSCTLYLANFMSTCTRTYLSTVAKNPVLMSTLRVLLSTFLNFYQIGKKLIVSQAFPHLLKMPLICLFSNLKKSGLIYFSDAKIKILAF